jgi:hypothetical protein
MPWPRDADKTARTGDDSSKTTNKVESDSMEPPGESTRYPSAPRLALTAISLGLSIFLVALDGTIVSTAIPQITEEFQSLEDVGWVSLPGSAATICTTSAVIGSSLARIPG